MKRWTLLVLGMMALTGLTGCMENAMLLKLDTDGSGTLTYRVFMSDDMLNMAQSMTSGMMQGMGMEEEDAKAAMDPFAEIKASLDGQFGPQAKLESTREMTNKQGWKGVEAMYAFDNVNELQLQNVEPVQAEGPTMQMDEMGSAYTFEFTPGDVATLKMVPITSESSDETAAMDPAVTEAMGGMNGMMEGMGMQMMAPMMKGMRMSFLVFLNGEVVETNAKFQSKKHPNVITLMDLQFDKILADPNGGELMKASANMDSAKLAAMDVDGLRVEAPDKVIEVKFK